VSPIAAPDVTGARAAPEPRLGLSRRGQAIVWLRRGARVALRAAPGRQAGQAAGLANAIRLSNRARRRRPSRLWGGPPTPLLPDGRLGWVKLDPTRLRSGWTPYSIDVDLSSRAARLRRAGQVLRSFAITVGSPTSPTPVGRFAITDTFRGHLNPAYGCCALATTATQPSFPSGWLGGNRIPIHGTTGPVGEAVSHGCVRADGRDVNALIERVGPGSPVVIRE
jgi:lipoprotein-anchoring transpeptidase ErfK/SrfK